jgi:glycosyltransferase involved in cell wall biosynthesis
MTGSRKPAVLHLITRLELGGAQQNTLYTVERLDRSRFDPVLACGRGGILDAEASALAGRGVRVVPLRFLSREIHPVKDLLAVAEICILLMRLRPAVLHTHSSKAGILGRLAAGLCRAPVVVHSFHGFGFHGRQPRLVRRLYIALERICARLSGALIFVSKANWSQAESLGIGSPERYVLIRSGIRLSDYPAKLDDRWREKSALGLGRHKPLVLSIGNLKPQKNPLDFIEMAARVLKGKPDAEFVFVGDGVLRPAVEGRILALGIGHRVKLLGWRRDAAEILALADVFVLTSLWEGLPRALVEALKSGVPAVAYATDGVKDVLKDDENGYAVQTGDVAALSERVLRLLTDDALRARMASSAAASIGREFDIDGMVRSQEELYSRLLASKSK